MTILIVNENKDALRDIISLIEQMNTTHSYVGFGSPYKALKYAESKKIDLIICDFKFSDSTGFGVILKMKKINKNIYSVLLADIEDYALQAIEVGIDNFIVKPITYDKIFKCLDNASRYRS